MRKIVILLLLTLALALPVFLSPKSVSATWFLPMDDYYKRQTVKGFGENIDENFYKGKESLFPYNRFYGFHTAIDLEVFPDEIEKKVPVYAVSSGMITYIGTLSGYGGVILEKLDDESTTVLYGHVKIKDVPFQTGDRVGVYQDPVILTYLGDQFSPETSKERKHLHIGIYRGTDLYFTGHERTRAQLDKKWYDPNVFLKAKGAMDPKPEPSPTISVDGKSGITDKDNGFFGLLVNFLKRWLHIR
jgi:murein DD-endopeptidase MepM/ murein hydrolase activator NlpD